MNARTCRRGFTLLEIILTLILISLAGLASFAILAGVVTRSAEPLQLVQQAAQARETMEGYSAKYRQYLAAEISWADFKAQLPEGSYTEISASLGADFEVLEVTVGGDGLSTSTLFSE